MKQKSRKTLLIVFPIIVIVTVSLVLLYQIQKSIFYIHSVPGKIEDVVFILIKDAYWGYESDILKPNAAILITNKKEIDRNQQLFLAEQIMA